MEKIVKFSRSNKVLFLLTFPTCRNRCFNAALIFQYLMHCFSTSNEFTIFIHLSLHTMNSTVLIPVQWPCSPWVLVAQWIERSPCIREVMGLTPVGHSNISLSHARAMLINSSFTSNESLFKRIIVEQKKSYIFSIFCPHGRCFVLIAFLWALHFCT